MKVKNVKELEYFTAVDKSEITELYGVPTEGMPEVSLAYAVVHVGNKTDEHYHNFFESYTIAKGKGIMYVDEEKKEIVKGDTILIPAKKNHWIENTAEEDLEFYCVCVPAFTPEETVMKQRVEQKNE